MRQQLYRKFPANAVSGARNDDDLVLQIHETSPMVLIFSCSASIITVCLYSNQLLILIQAGKRQIVSIC
jgi:hypothetical protein